MLSQVCDCQSLTTTETESAPAAISHGFDRLNTEFEDIRSERDALQARLGQAIEQAETAKSMADAFEEKILTMQKEIKEHKEMRLQAESSGETIE